MKNQGPAVKREPNRPRAAKPGRPSASSQMSHISFDVQAGKNKEKKSRRGSSSQAGMGNQRRDVPPTIIPALTKKIVGKMMTCEPISCADLVTTIADTTTDAVQSILDTLVILGVVVSLRLPSTTIMQGRTHNSVLNPTVYTLVGFMRAPEPIDIAEFDNILTSKEENTKAIRSRVDALRELSNKEMPQEERCNELKNFLSEQMSSNSDMKTDLLYQTVLELLQNKQKDNA